MNCLLQVHHQFRSQERPNIIKVFLIIRILFVQGEDLFLSPTSSTVDFRNSTQWFPQKSPGANDTAIINTTEFNNLYLHTSGYVNLKAIKIISNNVTVEIGIENIENITISGKLLYLMKLIT